MYALSSCSRCAWYVHTPASDIKEVHGGEPDLFSFFGKDVVESCIRILWSVCLVSRSTIFGMARGCAVESP
jgi:hypothetical protein